MKEDHFHASMLPRIYDRTRNCFTFNIAYETAAKLTPRSIAVAEAFGLGLDDQRSFVLYDNVELRVSPGDVALITGDSGSGKSVLLRAMQKDLGSKAVDMGSVRVEEGKPLIETVGGTVDEGLDLLSRVGLGDAFLFLRTYEQLSDGQKYRYRIARMIESGAKWWFMDEFCATLDRDTAKVVAFNLQKLARSLHCSCVVATSHLDLFADLGPSVHVHKRYGREICIVYYPNEPVSECSLVREMRVEPGTTRDWHQLEMFHYRNRRPGAVRRIFRLVRGDELCGVVVYNYPPMTCLGRRMVLPGLKPKQLNQMLSTIGRIVVHPKYRSIGLGAYLIRETLAKAGTRCVELVAVMARYNPFAERAGMRLVFFQVPGKHAVRICAVLEELGFEPSLLGSESYILKIIKNLSPRELRELRGVFAENCHPRLMKEISVNRHKAYGIKADYISGLEAADLAKLASLVRVVGLLLQVKAYLFWRKVSS